MNFQNFLKRIPTPVLLSSILLPLGGVLLSIVTDWGAGSSNTGLFLSALAGAQSGVLAIVFSVTLIGVQLVGTRYSPRMVSAFTEQPVFVFTFGLFVVSIALDLWLLYNIPGSPVDVHTAGVFAASGLAVAVAYSLFVFVREATQQSTPEGAIDVFVSSMNAERYLSEVEVSVENGSDDAHPMRPLYNLIMNALSKGERVTAEKAIREYGELSQEILRELDDNGVFESADRGVEKELFGPVLKEHLVEIALHAEELDESKIVRKAVEWQYELGCDGIDRSVSKIAWQSRTGFSNILRDSPVETSLVASGQAWKRMGELLVDAAEHPDPEIVRAISSSIRRSLRGQLFRIEDFRWYREIMMDLYRNFEAAHEILLGEYSGAVAEADMRWQFDHVPDDDPNREQVYAVFSLKRALFETTSSFMTYLIEYEEYPVIEGNFKDSWRNLCIEASKTNAEDYAIVLCQAMIEIAFIDRRERPEQGISWSNSIGKVMHDGDAEIVEAAFDRILQYEYMDDEPGLLMFSEDLEKQYKTYYQNQINIEEYSPLNTHIKFDESIKNIRSSAIERKAQLEEHDR